MRARMRVSCVASDGMREPTSRVDRWIRLRRRTGSTGCRYGGLTRARRVPYKAAVAAADGRLPVRPHARGRPVTLIDRTTPFGLRVARRLEVEALAWLTTVGADGTPQPVPVWFLWEAEKGEVLVYSKPGTPKLANIAARPRVSLHLDGDGRGGDVVVLTGTAAVSGDAPADQVAAYVEKYRWGIARIGMTPAAFALAYAVPLRVTVAKIRGH